MVCLLKIHANYLFTGRTFGTVLVGFGVFCSIFFFDFITIGTIVSVYCLFHAALQNVIRCLA